MSEDTIFLGFVWLCLAGPFLLFGLGFLLNIKRLMGYALFFVTLLTIFGGTNSAEMSDSQAPASTRARLIWGVVLIVVGVLVGVFFTGALNNG